MLIIQYCYSIAIYIIYIYAIYAEVYMKIIYGVCIIDIIDIGLFSNILRH